MMVNAWSYNLTRGPVQLYLIQQGSGSKGPLSSDIQLLLVAEVTLNFRYSCGRLLFTEHWLDPLYCYWAFLAFYSLIFLMKEPESKSDERNHLTLKRILEVVKQEWEETSLVLLDAHLSAGRDHHVYVFIFYYQQKISDLASWQVSLIMLIGSGFNLLAVYLASQIGKKWNSNQVFPILVAPTSWPCPLVGVKTPFAYLSVHLLTNALLCRLSTHLLQ